jgi:hypothetical protein
VTDALNFISNNSLASALIAAAVLATVGGVWQWFRNFRDSKKIYDYMLGSKAGTDFTFRSTEAISSHTRISENRVAELCGKHPKIKRNEKARQSWQIIV